MNIIWKQNPKGQVPWDSQDYTLESSQKTLRQKWLYISDLPKNLAKNKDLR